jgi:hypothetical protein
MRRARGLLAGVLLGLSACDASDIARMRDRSQGTLAAAVGMPMSEVSRRSTFRIKKLPTLGSSVSYATGNAYFDFELVGSGLRFHGCSMYSIEVEGPEETVTSINVHVTPKRRRWGAFRRELTETAAKLKADGWAPHPRRGDPTLESFMQDGSKIGVTYSGAIATFDWSKGSLLLRLTAHRAWDGPEFWSSFNVSAETWLQPAGSWDSFPAYPGARKVCSQHVVGSAAGERREIAWSLYAAKDKDDVFSFYVAIADWHGLKSDLVDKRLILVSPDGTGRLTLQDASDAYPDCGVRPEADEKALVVVSRATPD